MLNTYVSLAILPSSEEYEAKRKRDHEYHSKKMSEKKKTDYKIIISQKKAQYIKREELKKTDRYRILARGCNVGNLSHGIRRKCNMVFH